MAVAVGVRGRDLRPLRLRHRHARDALRAAARPRGAARATRRCPSAPRADARARRRAGARCAPLYERVRAARARACSTARAPGGSAASSTPSTAATAPAPLRAVVQPGAGRRAGRLRAVRAPRRAGTTTARPGSVTRARARRGDARGPRRACGASCSGSTSCARCSWRLAPDHDPLAAPAGRQRRGRPARPATACSCGCSTSTPRCPRAPTRPPLDLVLEVDDPFCPWNAGRHRPARRRDCEPHGRRPPTSRSTPRRSAPIYLGGTPLDGARRRRPRARAAPGRAGRGRDGVPRRRRAVVPGDLLGAVLRLAADAAAAGAGLGGRALR